MKKKGKLNPSQYGLFIPDSDWAPPASLPDPAGFGICAVDTETWDPHLTTKGPGWATGDGEVVGVAFKTPHHNFYLPMRHRGGGNLAENTVLLYTKAVLENPNITKIFHNSLYDVGWLKHEGISTKGPVLDTQFGGALLDENRFTYRLDHLCRDWLGKRKDEHLLTEAAAAFGVDPKAGIYMLHSRFVGPYAEIDSLRTWELWEYEHVKLEEEGLLPLMKLECSLVNLFVDMRMRGVRVDEDYAEQLGQQFLQKEKELLEEAHRQWGVRLDVWSGPALANAFNAVGLPYPTTRAGAPSFIAEWLERHSHPLPQMIASIRKVSKSRTTFIESMIQGHVHKGRIHCEFHPLRSEEGGTVSGRLSSSNPNLQQVPNPEKEPNYAPLVRGLFIPEPGQVWGAFDYSSQEPRLTVHFAALANQPGALEAVRAYNENPRLDYHQWVANMCGITRKQAKPINLGLAYGMGGVKLCHELGLPTRWVVSHWENGQRIVEDVPEGTQGAFEIPGPEGLALLETYHAGVPFIKGLSELCSRLAARRGWIKTIENRRCRFDLWEPTRGYGAGKQEAEARAVWGNSIRRAGTHKALNRLIQGSAADMTKLAMLHLYNEGFTPLLQVHDELDFSLDDPVVARRIEEIMRDCVALRVPVVVDAEYGPSWGKAKNKNFAEAMRLAA